MALMLQDLEHKRLNFLTAKDRIAYILFIRERMNPDSFIVGERKNSFIWSDIWKEIKQFYPKNLSKIQQKYRVRFIISKLIKHKLLERVVENGKTMNMMFKCSALFESAQNMENHTHRDENNLISSHPKFSEIHTHLNDKNKIDSISCKEQPSRNSHPLSSTLIKLLI